MSFVPDEFTSPIMGDQWQIDERALEENDSYTIADGYLNLDVWSTYYGVYQIINDEEFDIYTQITITEDVTSHYYFGSFSIFLGDGLEDEHSGGYIDVYFQYYLNDGFSLAYYLGSSSTWSSWEDPYLSGEIDGTEPVFFRFKYALGDKLRIYWSQDAVTWNEIEYVNSIIPGSSNMVIGLFAGNCPPPPAECHRVKFDYIRNYEEFPFTDSPVTFKSQMTTDLSCFFDTDEFAETVIYTAVGSAAANISAVVIREAIFQEPYVRGEHLAKADIFVKKSQVTNPQFGDTYTLDSYTWEMDPSRGVIYEDDQLYRIGLERRMS